MGTSSWAAALWTLLRRPLLLLEGLRFVTEIRRRGRPWPSRAYLGWRLQTAYGADNAGIPASDLIDFLRWRRELRRSTVGRGGAG